MDKLDTTSTLLELKNKNDLYSLCIRLHTINKDRLWSPKYLNFQALVDHQLGTKARVTSYYVRVGEFIIEYGVSKELFEFVGWIKINDELTRSKDKEFVFEYLSTAQKAYENRGKVRGELPAHPFSVLDSTTDKWQKRKIDWFRKQVHSPYDLEHRVTEPALQIAREENLFGEGVRNRAHSLFDPVLAELMYEWFCPKGGTIIDPFAGGAVRGIVAARCGYKYYGVDISENQVSTNEIHAKGTLENSGVDKGLYPRWINSDSRTFEPAKETFNFLFSCPPYFDLEVYSDNPADLSTMTSYDFVIAYSEIINRFVQSLADDSFACFVVGECRAIVGKYLGLIPTTIQMFESAGCHYYNEMILVTKTVGASRLSMFDASRKVVKCHQNVLVFVKGNAATATMKIKASR